MLVRSKFFSQFVEKIEKLELSLSKQHNKMLEIRSEMLKIIKNVKMIKLGKFPKKFSREFLESRGFSKFPKNSQDSRIIFKKFLVSREVGNPGKSND